MARQELIEEISTTHREIEANRKESQQLVDRVHRLANKIHCELAPANVIARRDLGMLDLIIFCNTGKYPTKGS